LLSASLEEVDPTVYEIVQKVRLYAGITGGIKIETI